MKPSRKWVISIIMGLCTGLVLMFCVLILLLFVGGKTRVWVDGCPDIAPPLAPAWWRSIFYVLLAPMLMVLSVYGGFRFARHKYAAFDHNDQNIRGSKPHK